MRAPGRSISQAVILAAGAGKRLRPLTDSRSKAMLPVVGKPLVARVMEGIYQAGVPSFVLVAGRGDTELLQYFHHNHAVQIVIQEQPLGMAHALSCAAPLIQGDFLLTACDNLVETSDVRRILARWSAEPHPQALLSLLRLPPEQIQRSSAVILEGEQVTRIIEKPLPGEAPSNLASLPLYLFSTAILPLLPDVQPSARGEYELQDAIQALIGRGAVFGMQVSGRVTMTYPQDLLALNLQILSTLQPALQVATRQLGAGTHFLPPVYIEEDVRIGRDCAIGPGVYIETGCVIEDGVEIAQAMLLRGAHLAQNTRVRNQVIDHVLVEI